MNVDPKEIEATYRRSALIKEICVLALADPGQPTTERLFAVVVPDLDLLRTRRIVNIGDWVRFEMEGQSIDLPPHKRVLDYELSFEPLPRTAAGEMNRHEVERRVRTKAAEAASAAAVDWGEDAHVKAAASAICARATGKKVRPGSNLELDLGFDSMERVALLTDLQRRFAVTIPAERTHEILTVSQLIEACRPASPRTGHSREPIEESWGVLLRDVPDESDPTVSGLLARRSIALPMLFGISRLAYVLFGPRIVTGLEHLPREGPYIISPNHQSYLDPVIICSVLPYRLFPKLFVVGAAEYFETALMRRLARALNLIPVDPDANLVSAMQASAFGLRHGKILILFPEGERSIDAAVKRFKKGAPILAQHLGVPVVPVAIRGAFELWPRNRAIRWKRLRPWSRHAVRVAFGPPMRFERTAAYADSAGRLRDAVARMWDELGP